MSEYKQKLHIVVAAISIAVFTAMFTMQAQPVEYSQPLPLVQVWQQAQAYMNPPQQKHKPDPQPWEIGYKVYDSQRS